MAHCISGIITSFQYTEELPHLVLVGNYYFLPVERRWERSFREEALPPFKELTAGWRKTLRELSFKGKCAYVETDFFGGDGKQFAEAWENGERIQGPLVSFYGYTQARPIAGTTQVEDAINEVLRTLGIYCHEGKDEFDSVGLGRFRSNEAIHKYLNASYP